ncbi:MAG: GAF domain-containing protein [Myxococcales bacterium]|nr:GAF domain-containing protein [Myxococcales bacterium]
MTQPTKPPHGWQLERRLGEGGGGTVWLARRTGGAGPVVVLKIAAAGAESALWREWLAMHDIPSPLLPWPVQWLPATEFEPAALAMTFRPGARLDTALAAAGPERVAAVVRATLRGLGALHGAGYVHGDLHPGNLLVQADGQLVVDVALLDLGLTQSVGQPVVAPGRLDCAAPDRLRGGLADVRDDLFSLAVAVWTAWGLGEPYPGYPAAMPAAGTRPHVPGPRGAQTGPAASVRRALIDVLSNWMALDREHRPASAETALRQWTTAHAALTDGPAGAHAEAEAMAQDFDAVAPRPWRWGRWPDQALPTGPAAGECLYVAGPPGAGHGAVLRGLQTASGPSGRTVVVQPSADLQAPLADASAEIERRDLAAGVPASITASPEGAGRGVAADAGSAGAAAGALDDRKGSAAARRVAQWVALLQRARADTVLLVDGCDAWPPGWLDALEAAQQDAAPDRAAVVLAGRPAPGGAAQWTIPEPGAPELGAWLQAVAGGRAWDGALLGALLAWSRGTRSSIATLAARLLRSRAVVVASDRVDAASGMDVGAALQAATTAPLTLPAETWWPVLAHAAVVDAVQPGDAADPLPAVQAGAWRHTALLRPLGGRGLAVADPAARAFLLDRLPPTLVGAAARTRAELVADRTERLALLAFAAARDAGPLPEMADFANAAEVLLARDAPRRALDLVTALRSALDRRAQVAELSIRGRLHAVHMLALVADGQLLEAHTISAAAEPDVRASAPVLAARAELDFRRGDYPQSRAAADALARLATTARERAQAHTWAAFAATWQGDRATARSALGAARNAAQADASGGAGLAPTLGYLGALNDYYEGRLDAAETVLLALGPVSGGTLRAAVAGALGLVCHRRGDLAGARTHYDAARALAETAGDLGRALNMAMNAAVADQEAGDLGRALHGYDRIVSRSSQLGNDGARVRALANRGNLLAAIGGHVRAALDLDAALAALERSGSAYLEGNVRCTLAEIARGRGERTAAAIHLDRAEAALDQAAAESERMEIALERGTLALAAGGGDEAREIANRVRESAVRLGSAELQARALGLVGRTWLDAGPGLPDRAAVAAASDALAGAVALAPAAKPLLLVALTADRVRALLLGGQVARAREVACDGLGRLERVASTLAPAERGEFEGAPTWAPTRTLLRLGAGLPPQASTPAALGTTGSALHALVGINRRLSEVHELPPLLEMLMDAAVLLTGAERGFLLLDDGDPEREPAKGKPRTDLRIAVARNLDRENLKKAAHKLSHTIAMRVFESGERVLSIDAMVDERFTAQASIHAGSLRSILCVPLQSQGLSIGVLYVDNRFASGAFGGEQGALLEALADQAAIAIRTARLIERQRRTAEELDRKRAEVEALAGRLREQLTETEAALEHARADLRDQRLEVARRSDYSAIKGDSPKLQRLFATMDRVRDHDFPLLVRGESGTGKELVARAVHFTGRRKRGPFIALNCGALPSNLLESELFGHTRGSFTGAHADRRGLFEAASGGTLLLDEVGDMPLDMQVKLLRVLQSGEIQRVGDPHARRVDVRVVAATHRDLGEMARSGTFREDLLYRLRVVELMVPALRERADDLPLLCEHFLAENRHAGVGHVEKVGREAMAKLRLFRWPGNVRQLETLLKSACLFADGTTLELRDVDPLLERERTMDGAPGNSDGTPAVGTLDDIVTRAVRQRLAACGGNKRQAALSLGIDRGTLYAKLRE